MGEHKHTALQLRKAANISGVTYDQWRARGFIKSEYKADGSGDRQLYSFKEVYQTAVMARLVALRITVSEAVKHAANLHGFKNSAAYLLVTAFPDLEHDRVEVGIEEGGTRRKIVREENLLAEVVGFEASAIVSLDKVEARVKKALSADSKSGA